MPRIALVMIARNEARCIAGCLRSVRPWVDELIVLDTGSTDDTVAIAQSEGAQVHTSAGSMTLLQRAMLRWRSAMRTGT